MVTSLKPVTDVLDREGHSWTERGGNTIEIGSTAEVAPLNGGYVASGYELHRSATYNDPQDGTWIDLYVGPDAERAALEAIAWMRDSEL